VKTIKQSNFRVEVYPRTRAYGITVSDEKDICNEIIDDIKRHVDGVSGAYLVCDNYPVCASCGSKWTEDGDTYNGGCCKADQDAEDARTSNK
jgi:hypothetical protein